MTRSELDAALEPLTDQIEQLEVAMPRTPYRVDPLSIIDPVTTGEMAVQRDGLMREAFAVMDTYFGIAR